jgi:hypothetical protein
MARPSYLELAVVEDAFFFSFFFLMQYGQVDRSGPLGLPSEASVAIHTGDHASWHLRSMAWQCMAVFAHFNTHNLWKQSKGEEEVQAFAHLPDRPPSSLAPSASSS